MAPSRCWSKREVVRTTRRVAGCPGAGAVRCHAPGGCCSACGPPCCKLPPPCIRLAGPGCQSGARPGCQGRQPAAAAAAARSAALARARARGSQVRGRDEKGGTMAVLCCTCREGLQRWLRCRPLARLCSRLQQCTLCVQVRKKTVPTCKRAAGASAAGLRCLSSRAGPAMVRARHDGEMGWACHAAVASRAIRERRHTAPAHLHYPLLRWPRSAHPCSRLPPVSPEGPCGSSRVRVASGGGRSAQRASLQLTVQGPWSSA